MENIREKNITKTSIIGIIANILLSGLKAFVGFLAGAVSVILDAINNLSDAVSSVVTIIGLKLSKKKPDSKHPYGYGRIEYFTALVIGVIIIATGASSLVEAVKKIITPEELDFKWYSAVIIASAILVKVLLGLYTKTQGKKYNSDALVASGVDALMDALVSVATLVGIGVSLIWHVNIDGYVGCVIAVFILKAGLEILLESISNVMGKRPDAEITKQIKAEINKMDLVSGTYDLIIHNYGPDKAIGSVHVEISSELTADKIHLLTMAIQTAIMDKFHIFLTVGVYAINEKYRDVYENIKEIVKNTKGTLGCHGFFVDEEKKVLSFDCVIDFTIKDKQAFINQMVEDVKKIYPGYSVNINLDLNYSD